MEKEKSLLQLLQMEDQAVRNYNAKLEILYDDIPALEIAENELYHIRQEIKEHLFWKIN